MSADSSRYNSVEVGALIVSSLYRSNPGSSDSSDSDDDETYKDNEAVVKKEDKDEDDLLEIQRPTYTLAKEVELHKANRDLQASLDVLKDVSVQKMPSSALKEGIDDLSPVSRFVQQELSVTPYVKNLQEDIENLTSTIQLNETSQEEVDQLATTWNNVKERCGDFPPAHELDFGIGGRIACAYFSTIYWSIQSSMFALKSPHASPSEKAAELGSWCRDALMTSLYVFYDVGPGDNEARLDAYETFLTEAMSVYYDEGVYLDLWNLIWEFNAQIRKHAYRQDDGEVVLSIPMQELLDEFFRKWMRISKLSMNLETGNNTVQQLLIAFKEFVTTANKIPSMDEEVEHESTKEKMDTGDQMPRVDDAEHHAGCCGSCTIQ